MTTMFDLEDRRKNALTEDHVRLIVAEITSSLLKDQKTHLVSYTDKLRSATEEKFSERLAMLAERVKKVETHCEDHAESMHRIDRKIEMWVNRGVGVWALAITLFAILKFGVKFL